MLTKRNVIHELRREFVWMWNSRALLLVNLVIVALAVVFALHIVTSRNAIIAGWNSLVSDTGLSASETIRALAAPMHVQHIGDQIIADNSLKYEALRVLRAQASVQPLASIIGGVSLLVFVIFPILAFAFGATLWGREYRPGYLGVKLSLASVWELSTVKALVVILVLFCALVTLMLLLPAAVFVTNLAIGEDVSSILPAGFIQSVEPDNSAASLPRAALVFVMVLVVAVAFAFCGMLFGELLRGKLWFIALAVAAYYLLPLGNGFDPRNLLGAVGVGVFWFGGTFDPYAADLDLLAPAWALLILLSSTVVSWFTAAYVRDRRMHSVTFLRRHCA